MKTHLLCAIFCVATCFAQIPPIQWSKSYGGSGADSMVQTIKTDDGGYIVVGHARSSDGDLTSPNMGITDAWVVKITADGTIQWNRTYGGSAGEGMRAIKKTLDGGYIILGHTGSNDFDISGNHGLTDIWLFKINSTGDLQWQKCFGGSNRDVSGDLVVADNGDFLVIGTTESNDGDVTGNHGLHDVWIMRVNSSGNLLWQKTYGGTGVDQGITIIAAPDGGYVFHGATLGSDDGDVSSSNGFRDCWIVKIAENGVLQWQQTYGGSAYELGGNIIETSDGGYIMVAGAESSDGDLTGNHGEVDTWIVKLESDGDIKWQRNFGGTGFDHAQNDYPGDIIKELPDGRFVVGVTSNSTNGDVTGNHGHGDFWLLLIDPSGDLIDQHSFGGSFLDEISNVVLIGPDEFLLTGYTASLNGDVSNLHGNNEGWIVKLSSEVLSDSEFVLQGLTVHPNPVRTTLNLHISENAQALTTRIVSVSGQVVYDQAFQSIINVEKLSSGVYFIEIHEREKIRRSKFIKQ